MSAMNKLLIAASLTLSLSACKKEAPVEVAPAPAVVEPVAAPVEAPPAMPAVAAAVEVSAVNLGTTVGADQKVSAAATSFGNDDVIYAAVDTKNTGKDVVLAVKWTLDGKTVHEESTSFSPESDTTTDFKFGNSGTRQTGKYKLEVSLNGAPAQSVDFEIK